MKKRDFCETLTLLAKTKKDLLWDNGTINAAKLAKRAGMNQSTVHRMIEGRVLEPKGQNADKLCRFFGVDRDQLLGRKPIPGIDDFHREGVAANEVAEPVWGYDDRATIPMKKIYIRGARDGSSGFEIHYDDDDTIKPVYYRREWIIRMGYREEKLSVREVRGSSMEWALYEGDKVLINEDSRTPKHGVAFAVVIEGQLEIKRLQKRGAEWWITSDNPAYSKFDLPLENISQIIGEAVEKSSTRV